MRRLLLNTFYFLFSLFVVFCAVSLLETSIQNQEQYYLEKFMKEGK